MHTVFRGLASLVQPAGMPQSTRNVGSRRSPLTRQAGPGSGSKSAQRSARCLAATYLCSSTLRAPCAVRAAEAPASVRCTPARASNTACTDAQADLMAHH